MSDVPPLPAPTGTNNSAPPPPPHPLDSEWFLYIDGKSYGPFTGHVIKSYVVEGRVDPNTNVCPVGQTNWVAASKDAALRNLFSHIPATAGMSNTQVHGFAAVQAPPGNVKNDSGTVVQITQHFGPGPGAIAADIYGEMGPKSPGLALVLSFFICGVGQMYNGQVGKGIGMLVFCVVLWFVLLGWVIWIWSMIDAYSTAKAINISYHRRMGQQWPTQ